MRRFKAALIGLGLLVLGSVGCASAPELPSNEEMKQVVSELDRRTAELDGALQLVRAMMAPARVAMAGACEAFPSSCEVLAMVSAKAEVALAKAEKALASYREKRGDVQPVVDAILEARTSVEALILELSYLRTHAA